MLSQRELFPSIDIGLVFAKPRTSILTVKYEYLLCAFIFINYHIDLLIFLKLVLA